MPLPASLVGTACVVLGSNPALIGEYDANGYCVVKLGTHYARPAESFDLQKQTQDQRDMLQEWR